MILLRCRSGGQALTPGTRPSACTTGSGGMSGLHEHPDSIPEQVGTVPEQKPFASPPHRQGLGQGAVSGPPRQRVAPRGSAHLVGEAWRGETQAETDLSGVLEVSAGVPGAADTRLPKRLGAQSVPAQPGPSQLRPPHCRHGSEAFPAAGGRPVAPRRHHRAVPRATLFGEGSVGVAVATEPAG